MSGRTLGSIATAVALLTALTAGLVRAAAPDDVPWLVPYTGPSRSDVDATTLDGKVLCGYQGWFNTPGDGTSFGFTHWGRGLERPESAGSRSICGPMFPSTTRTTSATYPA